MFNASSCTPSENLYHLCPYSCVAHYCHMLIVGCNQTSDTHMETLNRDRMMQNFTAVSDIIHTILIILLIHIFFIYTYYFIDCNFSCVFQADYPGSLLHVSSGDDRLCCYAQSGTPLGRLHHSWSSWVFFFIHSVYKNVYYNICAHVHEYKHTWIYGYVDWAQCDHTLTAPLLVI